METMQLELELQESPRLYKFVNAETGERVHSKVTVFFGTKSEATRTARKLSKQHGVTCEAKEQSLFDL